MPKVPNTIHEKDDLLDAQEDFLIKENKKHVKVKNAYALEVEKCEKLSSELSTCHETIDNLRNENANLLAKVDSHVCNVSTPNPRDNNVDLLARIEELNKESYFLPAYGCRCTEKQYLNDRTYRFR